MLCGNSFQVRSQLIAEKIERILVDIYVYVVFIDRYLTEHIPDLSILPVTVTVSLLNKGLKLCDIHLKPQDRYNINYLCQTRNH